MGILHSPTREATTRSNDKLRMKRNNLHHDNDGQTSNQQQKQQQRKQRKGNQRKVKRNLTEQPQEDDYFHQSQQHQQQQQQQNDLDNVLTSYTTTPTTTNTTTTTPNTTPIRYHSPLNHDSTIYSSSPTDSAYPNVDHVLFSNCNQIVDTLIIHHEHEHEEENIPIPFDHSAEHQIYNDEERLAQLKRKRFPLFIVITIMTIALIITIPTTIIFILIQNNSTSNDSYQQDNFNRCILESELLVECPSGYLEIPTCARSTFQQLLQEFIPQNYQIISTSYPCTAQYYGLVAAAMVKIHSTGSMDGYNHKNNNHDSDDILWQYWLLATFYFALGGKDWKINYNWLSGLSPCEENWYGVSCHGTAANNRTKTIVALDMSVNRLLGSLPTEMMRLTSLQILRLTNNDISGTIPTEIGGMQNLSELYLADTNVGGTIPTEIGLCTKLRTLNLQGRIFTGQIPSEIGHLSELGKDCLR
jgi:hypothetical protein